MKKLLTILLTLATLTAFSFSSHALAPGDTLYLTSSEKVITSATAHFVGDSIAPGEDPLLLTPENNLSTTIPSGATEVYFMGMYEDDSTFTTITSPLTLPAGSENMYDLATRGWSVWQAPDPDETPVDPPQNTPDPDGGSDTVDQNRTTITISGVLGSGETDEIVSVYVTWEDMEFTYTPASSGTWDPNTHRYTGTSIDGVWSSSSNGITVTNHSNVGVTASLDFESEEDLDIDGEFRNADEQATDSITLPSAVGTEPNEAPSERVTFHVTEGTIDEDHDSLGTITVTIAKTP